MTPEDILVTEWAWDFDVRLTATQHRGLQQAIRRATQGADARPVAAWLVTGGKTFVDRPYLTEASADKSISERKDGARKVPLYATRDAAPSLPHDAWKAPFDERHEFDVYPDHFMTGLRNEFAAGWHAAIKATAASAPREKTSKLVQVEPSLTRCAAARDGECFHAQCPQLKDGEPAKSGRHCPIDNWGDDD